MTTLPRVLMLETVDEAAEAELRAAAEVVPAWDGDPLAVAGHGPVHAIMTRGRGQVTVALFDACPDVRTVARCGVGLDNVDVAAATERGVPVLNLPACNAQTIAEHTVMLMLAVTRGLVASANAVRAGDWASRAAFDRDEVFGKTVGIVGLGNIGGRVARVCAALGMQVVYVDPHAQDAQHERVDLDTLLARADVITLHCQLDTSTEGLLDAGAFARMKPGAVLINTARGGLIDHAALEAALRTGRLAGFGADVLDVEPPPSDRPLIALSHVVVTPHVGSLTRSTYRDICVRSVRNVLAVLRGDAPEAGCIFNARELRGTTVE